MWTKFNLPSGSSHDLPLGGLAPSNHAPHCTQFNLLLRERNSTSCCLHGHTPPYGPHGAGFYPGDWDGGSRWEGKESLANMMHVSATSAAFLAAAAELQSTAK